MSQRIITLSKESLEQLYEIMKKRGFPKKPVSESEVVEEAISLLHSKLIGKKKGEKEV